MTVADPLPAMRDLHRSLDAKMAHDENLAKQKQALDLVLLCRKLEAFRREQDIVRVRREKRNAIRDGTFVLRAPSKQLSATATQVAALSEQPSAKRKHESELTELASQPILISSATTAWIEQQQKSSRAPIVNTRSASKCDKQEKRGSLSGLAKERMSTRQTAHSASPSRMPGSTSREKERPEPPRRLSSRTDKSHSNRDVGPDDERGRLRHAKPTGQRISEYRPGDAAKRRTENVGSPFPLSAELDRALRFSNLHDLRFGPVEHEVQGPSALQDWESRPANTAATRLRSKMAVHDRPNWCQESQNGDSPRHTIHIFPRGAGGQGRPKSAGAAGKHTAPFMQIPVEASNVTEGHLVADAVKIIKRQEKIQKRRSMLSLGLFKK